jgi:hypothetical protein
MGNWWPAIIASAVSTGAVALVYFLIRRMVLDVKEDTGKKVDSINSILSEKFERVWVTIDSIRENYMEARTHELVCGKNALEIEKLFKGCLKNFEDNMFEKMRLQRTELINHLDKVLSKVEKG